MALVALLLVVTILLTGCGQNSGTTPTASSDDSAPQVVTSEIALADRTQATTSVAIPADSIVSVSAVVHLERREDYADCGGPSLMDPFGNLLLTMSNHRSNDTHMYEYAFHAVAEGEYELVLDNAECDVRSAAGAPIASSASVTWTITSLD